MHFFGSAAVAALGILASTPALAALGNDAPCDEFHKRHGHPCVAAEPVDGKVTWLAGIAEGLEPAKVDDLLAAGAGNAGPVDFSGIPELSVAASVPFRISFDSGWDEVRVSHNGRELADLRVGKVSARTKKPVALEPGVNLFRVELRGEKRVTVEVHTQVRRLADRELEELAVARAYFEEVGPLLGTDADRAVLIPTDFRSHAPAATKGTPAVSRVGFKASVAGVPIEGAGISVVLTRDPKTDEPVPAGIFDGLPDLTKVPLKLSKTVPAADARRALAEAYAGGDERFVSQPALRWRVTGTGALKLMYHSFFYGMQTSQQDFDTEEAFTIARLWTDAATGTQHEYQDLVRRQFALTGRGRVFDGPLHDLDEGLRVHSIGLDETRRNLEGEHEWCASGDYAQVKNDSQSEHLSYNSRGRLVCGGLDADATPDLHSRAVLDLEGTVGTEEDDSIEAWTAFSHTTQAADFIRHHTGFVHDFPDRDRPSQLLVGINPQFRGYGVAVTNLRDAGNAEVGLRHGIFLGQEVRYGLTSFEGELHFMAGDFSRDADSIYHEFGHTILNALGVTTYSAFLQPLIGVVHEGFADYVARIMTGHVRQPSEFLYGDPEGHPDARARFCEDALPGDERFLALDSDDLPGSMRHVGLHYRGHTFGQAFCQALALAERRLDEVYGATDHTVLRLMVTAANDFPNRAWGREGSMFIAPILAAAEFQWVISQFHGRDDPPADHELRTSLALHGFVGDLTGAGAALTLDAGARRLYGPDETVAYTAATGVNPEYVLEFSHDEDGGEVCHRVSGETSPVDPFRTTRWAQGDVTAAQLMERCGDGGRVYVDLRSCEGAAGCDGPDVLRPRALRGTAVWIDLGAE